MKSNKTISLAVAALIVVGCEDKKDIPLPNANREETEERKIDSLRAIAESELLETVRFVAEVDRSLMSLTEQISGIEKSGENGAADRKERIQRNIALLSQRMEERKERLMIEVARQAELTKENKEVKAQLEVLQKMLVEVENLVVQKSQQIETLYSALEIAETERDFARKGRDSILHDLRTLASVKQRLADEKAAVEQTAWFIIGTVQELKQRGFTWHNTGFLGAGGNLLPSIEVEKEKVFTKINVQENNIIPLGGSFDRIHSSHAALKETFSVVNNELRINDPETFWKGDKFLIIEITD